MGNYYNSMYHFFICFLFYKSASSCHLPTKQVIFWWKHKNFPPVFWDCNCIPVHTCTSFVNQFFTRNQGDAILIGHPTASSPLQRRLPTPPDDAHVHALSDNGLCAKCLQWGSITSIQTLASCTVTNTVNKHVLMDTTGAQGDRFQKPWRLTWNYQMTETDQTPGSCMGRIVRLDEVANPMGSESIAMSLVTWSWARIFVWTSDR